MDNVVKTAVILTCHNRKLKTQECLTSLGLYGRDYRLDVYLTDDGSTDGTSEMVEDLFPEVHIIKGDGHLFWNRGMYKAWIVALKNDYDFYLWLNDDVVLYSNCLDQMFKCSLLYQNKSIISGLIEDDKHQVIYGGYDAFKRLVQKSVKPSPIKFMHGNVVLIPKFVVDKIGILDPVFYHDLGDVDYGLRALKNGVSIVSSAQPVAMGYRNNYCRVRKWNSNLITRFRKLYEPLGSPPSINFYFRKRHFGLFNAIIYWLFLHFINVLSDKMITIFGGNRYNDGVLE